MTMNFCGEIFDIWKWNNVFDYSWGIFVFEYYELILMKFELIGVWKYFG